MNDICQLFPKQRRAFWERTAKDAGSVQEIRLRAGQPVLIHKEGKEWFLDEEGRYCKRQDQAHCATGAEIQEILQHICHYSLYAYEDELRQGFITVPGGHRVGVAGRAVLEKEQSLRTIRQICFLNIRLSHQILGAADGVLPCLYEEGELQNTLVISPPGCGKTTLLRDVVRQISNGNRFGAGLRVGVVDERSEIAGCFEGRPQNDVGMRTDVLDACPKAVGIMLLLRAMSPQVIAIDELGGREDMKAVLTAASCGCKVLATVHGDSLKDVRRKEGMRELLTEQIFGRFLILGKRQGKCVVTAVGGREYYDADFGSNAVQCGLSGTGILVPGAVSFAGGASSYSEQDHGNDGQ